RSRRVSVHGVCRPPPRGRNLAGPRDACAIHRGQESSNPPHWFAMFGRDVRVPFPSTHMRIHEALEQFVLQLEANGRSPHTVAQYRRHIGAVARWLAPTDDLRYVDHQTIARFLGSPEARSRPDGKPKRATAVNALRGSLKNFFGYCA